MEFLFKFLVLLIIRASVARRKEYNEILGYSTQRVGFMQTSLQDHTVRIGQDISFICQIRNIGNYKVAWLHSEKGIIAVHPDVLGQNERIKSMHDNRDSWSLVIKSVQEADAGKYICQVNTEIPESISGTLSVEVPPDIIDEMSSSDTLVQEGMRVTLSCEATGVPKPIITWRRESKIEGQRTPEMLRLCNRTYSSAIERWVEKCTEVEEYVGDVLELTNINRFDSGVYLCIANNKVQPSVSKRVKLYVDFPPTLSVFHQLVGKSQGEQATLECLTSGHPPPFHFWKRNGSFIVNKTNKYSVVEYSGRGSERNTFSKLTIMDITEQDFGNYQCQAKNSLGETNGNIKLYEIVLPTLPTIVPTYLSTNDEISNQGLDRKDEDYLVEKEPSFTERDNWRRMKEKRRREKENMKRERSRDPWTSAGSLVSCSTTWLYTLSWFFSRIFCPAKMFLNS
ncbi:lachesin [Eurytemora carolleeae]|uniref:lachesin n=1 Tax=Eurytemora carolleeae TaxID=1294199 RepID=UPI000C779A19|nr:lachesin [Eurytemora carolleeae]|eukprot:XP_023336630.1 lachesin-like [Eurytemora affinis]